MKYWILRLLGHGLVLIPVIFETVTSLPYDSADGVLDKLKLTCSAAVIIAVVSFCLIKNLLKERIRTPAPWALACVSFLITAASRVVADKLFYITLAWALGSLLALIPYKAADRIKKGAERDG